MSSVSSNKSAGGQQAAPRAGQSSGMGRQGPRSFWKLYLLIIICVAPVIASYLAYYAFPPAERTNYGQLIEPQRPVPAIASTLIHSPRQAAAQGTKDGGAPVAALQPEGLAELKGKWLLLAIDQGACALPCAEKLFFMRQTHVSLGKERGRLERVLLVTDASPLPAGILAAHPDMTVLRVSPGDLTAPFPVGDGATLADHIYVIDPLHNLMMRFPKNPDPTGTRKDLQKLLRASRIG